MKDKHYSFGLGVLGVICALVVLGMSGCLTQVTGGGFLPSNSGEEGDHAFFGFSVDTCPQGNGEPEDPPLGAFTYLDRNGSLRGREGPVPVPGGVRFNASIDKASLIPCPPRDCGFCDVGQHEIRISYRSINPGVPGNGVGVLCVEDNGEGVMAPKDRIATILIESGPFGLYLNSGNIKGNIQVHECQDQPPGGP